ncbi:unnamed protein product [Triticum turgidum subsp. durum]|uniref:Glutaredoxin-like protein n=3 Tax=Triticum TaxID=4564 RepID=A0A9R0YUC4_TRITD|nr:unnamed protein product [Triticum turgidum subsp. durum]
MTRSSFGPWAINRSSHLRPRPVPPCASSAPPPPPRRQSATDRACPTITVMAAALSALLLRPAAVRIVAPRAHPAAAASRLLCAATAGEASSSPAAPRRLVLYTKPGCCLCDGLKEKLHAAVLLSGTPYSLASLELQERDITTNLEWERLYQYEIPVLAKVLPDGTEEILPRLSPRLTVELIQKKVSSLFDQ